MKKVGLYGEIEDAAVIPVPNSNLVMVKNIDIFTPIVDEPEVMGQIAACNVTNDVFALNVPEISGGMLVFLAIKTNTPDAITEGILKGIKTFMEDKVNSKISGGHTIYCDWPLIGGEASGFIDKDKIIKKSVVKPGDKLIVTKPVGLQATMAAYRVLKDNPEILENFSKNELERSIAFSIDLMTTSSQSIVKTIHSFEDFSFIHAMTDITGFGLAGHTKEMLQNSSLSARIDKVPSIMLSRQLSSEFGYGVESCRSHETAGGMLIAVDNGKASDFSNALSSNNISHWFIGEITAEMHGEVIVSKEIEFIDVETL